MTTKKSMKRKAEPEEDVNDSDAEELESGIDAEEQDEEESNDEMDDLDLGASDTESDDEDFNDSDNAESDTKPEVKKDPRLEKVLNKYREIHGKQLYIRLPHKLPEDDEELNSKIKAMSTLITKVHRPRQKHARFCLVDFATREDRDVALKEIKKANEKVDSKQKVLVNLPRTEDEDYVNELLVRKEKSIENKRAKFRLKRQKKKQSANQKVLTSSIVIVNLPRTATVSEVKKLFPHAVDVQIKFRKDKAVDTTLATINLPTTMDASKAIKQKLSLGGTDLVLRFSNANKKKKRDSKETVNQKSTVNPSNANQQKISLGGTKPAIKISNDIEKKKQPNKETVNKKTTINASKTIKQKPSVDQKELPAKLSNIKKKKKQPTKETMKKNTNKGSKTAPSKLSKFSKVLK